MINKSDAKKSGFTVIDSNESLSNDKSDIIQRIKAILPNVVNSDDILNIEALKDLIDISSTTANNQGYELTFAGKGIAKAKADIATDKALKAEITQSKNFDYTENIVIRGDNIDALKLLKQNYLGKIKMIYIDPPYNTKNENFVYNDNFKVNEESLIDEFGLEEEAVDYLQNIYGTRSHSGWLSFMYPRLKLARNLLTDDGVIFISIDDNEQANLKILCDEIFGESNCIANLIWKKRTGANDPTNNISQDHEYILIYQKFDANFKGNKKTFENYRNPDNDVRGNWTSGDLTCNKTAEERPNLFFDITDTSTGIIYKGNPHRVWRTNKEGMEKLIKDDKVIFPKSGIGTPMYKRHKAEVRSEYSPFSTWFESAPLNLVATKYLQNIFNGKIFDYTKPHQLIKLLINQVVEDNDIVLDFFAGSGTTGDAVMRLNAEDGGKRKFILVQLDEKIDKSKPAYDFCNNNKLEPVISSITIERLNRAGEKIKKELESSKDMFDKEKTLDIGYKVFSLTEKTFVGNDGDMLAVLNNNISTVDKLYNMMVATSQILTTKIETIEDGSLYLINNAYYVLGDFKSKIEDMKNRQIYFDAYANISLEKYLNLGVFGKETVSIIY